MKKTFAKNTSVLKQVFDKYIEETISDEQTERVLAPVIRLIMNGAFNRPHRFFGLGGRKSQRPVDFLAKIFSNK